MKEDEYKDFITVCKTTIGHQLSPNNCDKFNVLEHCTCTNNKTDERYVYKIFFITVHSSEGHRTNNK